METVEDRFEWVADPGFDYQGAEMVSLSPEQPEPEDDISYVDFGGPPPGEAEERRKKKNRVRDGIVTAEDLDDEDEGVERGGRRKGSRNRSSVSAVDSREFTRGGRVTRPSQKPQGSVKALGHKGGDGHVSGRLSTWLAEHDARRARRELGEKEALAAGASLAARADARRALSGLHRPERLERKGARPPRGVDDAGELFLQAKPSPGAVATRIGPAEPYVPPAGPPRPSSSSELALEPCSCQCHERTAVEVLHGGHRGELRRPPAEVGCAEGDREEDALTLFTNRVKRKRRRRRRVAARREVPDVSDWKPEVAYPSGLGPLGPVLEWLPCSCSTRDAVICSHVRFGPRILACRVDTLHLSMFCSPREKFLEELAEKREQAQQNRHEKVHIMIGRERFTVHPHGAGSVYGFKLTHEFCDIAISKSRAKEVPALRFELRAVFLASAEVEGAWKFCDEMTALLHEPIPHGKRCATFLEPKPGQIVSVCDCGGPRPIRANVTRADLAVDVIGADFAAAKMEHFVMRARSRSRHKAQQGRADKTTTRNTQLELVSEDGAVEPRLSEPFLRIVGDGSCDECDGTGKAQPTRVAEHWSGLKVSGYSFGRSEISARIYDKTREIREQSRDKVWNYEPWSEAGWVAGDQVWRVEVQLRRKGLKELCDKRTLSRLNIDTLEGFRAALASIWSYCVGGASGHVAWFKWCAPGAEGSRGERRARWKVRPEWHAIQRATWERAPARPVVRQACRDAKFHVLMAQRVGLDVTLAALAGQKVDGTYPTIEELLGPARELLTRKGKRFEDRVFERVVELDADAARSIRTAWEREREEHERVKAAKAEQRQREAVLT